ncbi:MAG TPA: nucleotidyltransferase domain-containing protein [Leptolyngbyaceae cyanobacterium]
MRRDEVLAIVKAHQAPLQELGVKSLDLFGSVALDEARPDSDVDFWIARLSSLVTMRSLCLL